ncbi:flavodoxin family protein [Desulfoferrobacter suflitae]|uniref:flavodoxin family protein n=1 Tax=Desulfoferrobacter suflitae TaxID=2865782 RepID=UPI002164C51D|nr:flavodoxin family protein [Desulfoferrobacter suflitae]MCK8600522.1 flavodoxin family protein [Desulfoferrobacter suflitae]
MKILGFEGSPRENGNTEKLVKTILEGAGEKGAETAYYKIARMRIAPCLGCMDCRTSGICIHEDDMTPLYDEIRSCDAMIIGSPIYMWQVNAQTKTFIDRLVLFVKPDFSTRLNGRKRMVLAFTQGNPDAGAFKTYFDYLEKLFTFLHYAVKGTIVAAGTRHLDDLLQQTEVLEKAKKIGMDLVP